MSGDKFLSSLLIMCSIFSAFPAFGAIIDIHDGQTFENGVNNSPENQNAAGLTIDRGDVLSASGVNNVTFNNNKSVNSGGAMKALNGFVAGDGWTFKDNHSDKISGGLYINIPQNLTDGELNRDVVFGENTMFTKNSSNALGGALGIEAADSVVIGDNAKFEYNESKTDGGAIAIWTDASNNTTSGTVLTLGQVEFVGNTAGNRGGALANLNNDDPELATDFNNTVNIAAGANFVKNSAEYGGAVYNMGNMNFNRPVEFYDNESKSAGGAIYNSGVISIIDSCDNTKDKTRFLENSANIGGAIYNADTGKIGQISQTLFQHNSGNFGGAINNSNLTGAVGGGVIDKITQSSFIENTAGAHQGGAIRNQGIINTIETVAFMNNTAGNGGAINNGSLGYIGKINATFTSNQALNGDLQQGGAIVNAGTIDSITDSTFSGNRAGKYGGAIYNETTGKITFNGINRFVGNSADGASNDIHNRGTIILNDGTTTIGGGITGDGILTVNSGATLDIGSTALEQNTINLNGTMVAVIVNEEAFGKIKVDTFNVGDSGKLDLTLGSTGTYDFGAVIGADKITYNDAVYNLSIDGTNIIVETKSVDEIVKSSGVSTDSAIVMVGLANSDLYSMNIASMNAQNALAEGNIEYIENETDKIGADNSSIVQSVAASAQNQVLALASSRMNGGAVGRSGGDFGNFEYGIWAQGVMNRTKYADKFSGDTNGIVVGADALIAGKYTLGIGYAYNTTNIDSNTDTVDITSNSLFIYGQYKPNKWYLNTALNYAISDYTELSSAFGASLNAEYDTTSFGGQIIGGYDFAGGLSPELGVRYLYVSMDEYNNGLADINCDDTNFLTGIAGVRYSFAIESGARLHIRPELRAAVTYDFMSDVATTMVSVPGGGAYMVPGDRLSRLGGEFGIGLAALYNGLEVSLNYDLDLHEHYTSQTGMIKVRLNF